MEWAKDVFAPFLAAVGAGVVLAVLGWAWLKLEPSGQRFWKTLGTFTVGTRGPLASAEWVQRVEGIRTLFVVAAIGLIVALAAMISALVGPHSKEGLPGPPGPQGTFKGTVSFRTVVFGQRGSSEDGHDPGDPFPGATPGIPKAFAPVAKFPICGFLEIRTGHGGNCRLSQNAGQWEVMASDNIACSVVCYQPVLSQ